MDTGEPRRATRIVVEFSIPRSDLKKTTCASCRRTDVYLARVAGGTAMVEFAGRRDGTVVLLEHYCPVARGLVETVPARRWKGGRRGG